MTVFVVVDGDQPGKVKEVCRITEVQKIEEQVSESGKEKNLIFSVEGNKTFKHSLLDFSFIIGRESYVGEKKKEPEESEAPSTEKPVQYGPGNVEDAEIVHE